MSKRHATLSNATSLRILSTVECCFDNAAVFGNNVGRNFVLSTESKQIKHVQFVSTSSKGQNFVRHCCQKRQQCSIRLEFYDFAVFANKVECCFDKVERCFDIVAGVDGALRFV